MDNEEVQKLVRAAVAEAIAPMSDELKELRTKNEELRKKFSDESDKTLNLERENKRFKADKEDAEKDQAKEAIKLARELATSTFEDAVKEKKITPAQRDQAMKMFGIDDDERVIKLDLEDLRKYFSLQEKGANMGGKDTAHGGGGGSDGDDNTRVEKDVFKEVDRLIRVQMSKDAKKTYRQAVREVFIADPKLHKEYLRTAPPEKLKVAASGGDS